MKIFALNGLNISDRSAKPNFCGYYDAIKVAARTPVKDVKVAEDLFQKLITEIDSDKQIVKNQYFQPLKKLYEMVGLKGLFFALKGVSENDSLIGSMIKMVKNGDFVSAAKNHSSVLEVFSFSGKLKDIRIGFLAGSRKGHLEFYLDKKGDLFVDRSYDKELFSSGFYSDTGTKKIEIESYSGGKPDTTYYNKDGSKSFFKNWLWGGTPTEGIF